MNESIGASRLAYHLDGTVVLTRWTGLSSSSLSNMDDVHEIPPIGMEALNSLYGGRYGILPEFKVLFPIPMDIRAILTVISDSPQVFVSYSKDSLTGDDGTWSSEIELPDFVIPKITHNSNSPLHTVSYIGYEDIYYNPVPLEERVTIGVSTNVVVPDYSRLFSNVYESPSKIGVHAVDMTRVTALHFRKVLPDFGVPDGSQMFLWGSPSTGEKSDYIQIQDTEFSEPLSHEVDLGTFPPHTSMDRLVRVRNMSLDRTATDILVTASPDEDFLPSPYRGMVLLSLDGVTWRETVALYNLSPSTVSPTIRVRMVSGAEFPAGPGELLLTASVGRWL